MAVASTDKLKSAIDADEIIEGEGSAPKTESEKGEETETEKEGEGKEDVIPVRRSSLHNVQGFTKRKASEEAKEKSSHVPEKSEDEDEGEDDELTPESRGLIRKEISRGIEPLRNLLVSQADEQELNELYANNSDAKKYDRDIRKYKDHPAYAQVPIISIYRMIAFEKAETTGAQKRNVANVEARQSRTGGHSRRPQERASGNIPSEEEINEMSDAELEGLRFRVNRGEFRERK